MQKINESIEQALKLKSRRQRYEVVYDALCAYLDKEFADKNHCAFECGKCAWDRARNSPRECGCCYSFENDWLMNIKNKQKCQYVGENGCTTQNLSCKLSCCKFLTKKGIDYKLKQFPQIKKVFSRKQRDVLALSYFKNKEQIIDKLLSVRKNKWPYFIFLTFRMWRINSL